MNGRERNTRPEALDPYDESRFEASDVPNLQQSLRDRDLRAPHGADPDADNRTQKTRTPEAKTDVGTSAAANRENVRR